MINPKVVRNQFKTLMASRGYQGSIKARPTERGAVQLELDPPLANDEQIRQAMQVAAQIVPGCLPTASNAYVLITPNHLAYSWTGQAPAALPAPAGNRTAPRKPREFGQMVNKTQKPRPAYLDPAVVIPFLLLALILLALLSRAL